MKSMIKELWHGNIIPGEDSRNNSKEMKELLGYMARHHEDLEKTFTDEQKEIFEKFHVAKSETIEYRFGRVKPPKARSWQSRASAGTDNDYATVARGTDNDYATVARGWDEYVSLAEAAVFEYAFRLGARLAMEVQSDTTE